MNTYAQLKKIIDDFTYTTKDDKSGKMYHKKYQDLCGKQNGNVSPKDIHNCESAIIGKLANTSLKAALINWVAACKYLFGKMYEGRETNDIKSKFRNFYKSISNKDEFVSVMNHKFPSNSSLNNANRQKLFKKLKTSYADDLDFINALKTLLNLPKKPTNKQINLIRNLNEELKGGEDKSSSLSDKFGDNETTKNALKAFFTYINSFDNLYTQENYKNLVETLPTKLNTLNLAQILEKDDRWKILKEVATLTSNTLYR